MKRTFLSTLALGALAFGLMLSTPAPANAADTPPAAGVNAGSLDCDVEGGVGLIVASSRDMKCVFTDLAGNKQNYTGSFSTLGADIGYHAPSKLIWAVFAPGNVAPGGLAGAYGGGTASFALGVGVGANALVGGFAKSFGLQPVSFDGNVGLDVNAGGLAVVLNPA